jgi:hypothetical protein
MENKTLAWPEIPKNARVEKTFEMSNIHTYLQLTRWFDRVREGPIPQGQKAFPCGGFGLTRLSTAYTRRALNDRR